MKSTHIPLMDAGFRHGHGAFETLWVEDGMAEFKDWHLQSLRNAAAALKLPRINEDDLNETPSGSGIWRWFVTPSGTFTLWELASRNIPAAYSLSLSPLSLCSLAWDARFKTLSYLLHVQAKQMAPTNEVILLNEKSEVASASMANIFWVSNEKVYTPDSSCGCREGILRRWILEQSGVPVETGRWQSHALQSADEIFLTNSRIRIVPVSEWNGRRLESGKITRFIQNKLNQHLA